MAENGDKKRNSQDSITSNDGNGEGNDHNKEDGGGKKKNSEGKSLGCDIFDDAAMENAYYVCHNIQDVLKCRGFPWPDGQTKKKKGKK